jgi:hypothetical protein
MAEGGFIEAKQSEAHEREEMLRKALEEQLKRSNNAEHALPIERLMDRLSASKSIGDEEYAETMAALEKSLAQLKVKRRRRSL